MGRLRGMGMGKSAEERGENKEGFLFYCPLSDVSTLSTDRVHTTYTLFSHFQIMISIARLAF